MNLIVTSDLQDEGMTHNGKLISRSALLGSALGILAAVFLSSAAVADEPALPYAACLTCHGDAGNNPIPGMLAPKLAGLDAQYITKQLHDYQSGRRVHEAMNTLAKTLSESDVNAAAEYFSSQTRTPDEVTDKVLAKQGEAIIKHGYSSNAVPACVNCHNDGMYGAARYPRVAGQKPDYLINQLTHFKSGERHNDFGQMSRVAMRLTDDQIKAVAEYISTLN